ncbi:hypothetical protein ZIOFF_000846 [Zingiber officinale]|uniref:C2H2-type domain-containing protein n=1 Tax=Zingiber officinale TaxID=94328 RepID=A0A8J5M816_ZINOF|nr:hypothetical protein ZIOFF_000846 [Zingiber officinale]
MLKQVETRTLEELEELLEFSSQNRTSLTRIMMDNMVVPLPNGDVDVSMLKDAVQLVNGRFETENEDALSRNTDPSQVASIKEADKYCKTILMKLTRNFGCMKGSVLVLVLGIASYSYCYLLSIPPMLRKYGFHLVLSGNRYYISDQVSNIRQHIKAVHQNLRPFACRFSECGKKFPYKHVRDNHEKSGVHSDFLEIDEQWQSRPRGGRKRKCPSIGSFCRKRIVSPEQASTLMYNVLRNMMQAEFCWCDEIEQLIVFVQAEFRFPVYPTLFLASNLSFFTNLKYSRVEIDEVRFEWAECMLDYI